MRTIKLQMTAVFVVLQFSEIIPYIDENYKTTNDRGISGHSLEGLFTAWCFINTKDIFTRYGINSPSLWWNNYEVLTQAETFFSNHKTLDIPETKIFISVGQKEPSNMIMVMEKFSGYQSPRPLKMLP